MSRFLVDEDMPRSLAKALREQGFEAEDVREVGLRGASDAEVFRYAVSRGLALLTGDLGFGNILRFPLGSHRGIILARLPNEMPTSRMNEVILNAVRSLSEEDIRGSVIVIEPDRIRRRQQT